VKLGIKPGHLVHLLGAPRGWSIPELPQDVRLLRRRAGTRSNGRPADVTVVFCRRAVELVRTAPSAACRLDGSRSLWIAWPRRAGGHQSDVTDSLVRATLLPIGVVDVKVAALDADWSGLKFVRRRDNRARSDATG
jgi:hypothetical protein